MSELKKRILFAVVAAPAFISLMWLGGWYFYGLMFIIGLLIHWEFFKIVESDNHSAQYASSLLIFVWIFSIQINPAFAQSGLVLVTLLFAVETLRKSPDYFQNISSTIISGFYPGMTVVSIAFIRSYYDFTGIPGFTPEHAGFAITLLFVLMIWGNDVFAYFGGKTFGKRPLAPTISPKKTWEGFYSGFIGGFAALGITYAIFSHALPDIWLAVPVVFITGIFGPLGDLAQSKMKRSAQIKDSSNILPGHGGFFDRFDAMMLAAPIYLVYIYLVF